MSAVHFSLPRALPAPLPMAAFQPAPPELTSPPARLRASPFLASRSPAAAGVIAVHALLLVGLLLTDKLDQVLPVEQAVSVSLLAAPAEPKEVLAVVLPAPQRLAAPVMPLLMAPVVNLPGAPPLPAALAAPEAARATTTPAAAVPAPSPAPAPVAVPAPAPPRAEPRQVPPGAIGYRVLPAIEVPLASRRLGESGTVWLRVHVDRQGQPKQVTVQRSSGFSRLDDQAVAAMQAARFAPQTEDGMAIEWIVIAPLVYELD